MSNSLTAQLLHDAETQRQLPRSISQQVSVLVEDTHQSRQEGASVLQSCCNVVNIFVGFGLLSMPYALSLSGWSGVYAMALTAGLFGTCGFLFMQALDALPLGTPASYPSLGHHAFGGLYGRSFVLLLTTLELLGSNTMCLIILIQQLAALLPHLGVEGDTATVAWPFASAALAILPLLFVPSIRHMAGLAMLGLLSTATIIVTVVLLIPLDSHRTYVKPQSGHHSFSAPGLLQAVGIFATSFSGHSTFPAIRATLARPGQFYTVIAVSFAAMLCIYTAVGLSGYWYFGDTVSPVVLNSMIHGSVYAAKPLVLGVSVSALAGALVALRAYTVFPAIVMVLQELLLLQPINKTDRGLDRRQGGGLGYAALLLRLSIFAVLLALAALAYGRLGSLISIMGGSCSMCCSVILPCAAWLILTPHEQRPRWKVVSVWLFMLLGCSLLVLVLAINAHQLLAH